MLRQRRLIAIGVIVVVGATACDADGSSQPATIPPTSAAPSPLPTTATTDSTRPTDPPTTSVQLVTTSALPDGAIGLSPDGPWTLVDSAPGITTPGLVYELMPKLWVYLPVQEDIPNGITWTLNEEDRPIIEAYLQAVLTRYRSTATAPAQLDDPGWSLYFTDRAASELLAQYKERSDMGLFTDLDLGVVLRPRVIGDDRTATEAVVTDCTLDGAVLRNADGSIATGSSPGVGEDGRYSLLVFVNKQWQLSQTGEERAVCD